MESGDIFDMDELEAVDINLLREFSQEDEQIQPGGGSTSNINKVRHKNEDPSSGPRADDKTVPDLPQASQGSAASSGPSFPTAPGNGQPFSSYEDVLKQRIESRLEQETQEKAKTNHALRQALRDQQVARDTIPVTVALIDYLGELKEALENNPEQFYCSLELPATEEDTQIKSSASKPK